MEGERRKGTGKKGDEALPTEISGYATAYSGRPQ